jgi:uncharacterized protein YjiS (DUF1127 family)
MNPAAPLSYALTLRDQHLPPLSRLVLSIALTLVTWELRRRTRLDLLRLDAHLLNDVGIDQHLLEAEIDKPFWRS